jgi:CubicO group peptidase (beta-lactamase class C family)
MMPPDMTIEEMAEKLASIPAHHHPGEQFTYGYSTDLLSRLIEIWSGKPLDEFIRDSVLAPLKMNDTSFHVSADKRNRFASCHTTQDGKLAILDKSTRSPFQEGFAFLSGGGGLTSTANDYAKFCQMLVDEGRANGTRILKPETLQLMFSDQLGDVPGDFRFGLGFAINHIQVGSQDNGRTVTQYSWGGYASTEFRVIPELKLFQIFIRQHVPMKNELAGEAFDAVFADPAISQGAAVEHVPVRRPQ